MEITNLVALGGLAAAAVGGAVAGDVAGLTALVAGLVVLHGLRAITALSRLEKELWSGFKKLTHVTSTYSMS